MISRRFFLSSAATATFAGLVRPGFAASSTTVFDGATILDGQSGELRRNWRLVVSGEVIAAIGPAASVQAPPGAQVVTLDGATVLPGIVSDHVHLGAYHGTTSGPAAQNVDVILQQLALYMDFGVTTVASMGTNSAIVYDLRRRIRNGDLRGADFLVADRGIGVPKGAPPVTVGADQLDRPETVDQAREAVRSAVSRGADVIKLWLDDFQGAKLVKMAPEIYSAVIEEAHRNNKQVVAHIYYLEDAKALLRAGADVLGHGVRDQRVDAEFMALMQERGAWYIPTLGVDEAFYRFAEAPNTLDDSFVRKGLHPDLVAQFQTSAWRDQQLGNPALPQWKAGLQHNLANTKLLFEQGLNVGFGTDSGAMPLRVPGYGEHRELELLVQAGLTPLQAIRLATEKGAAAMKLHDRGVLLAGKRADFLIVDGDPSQSVSVLRQIRGVWAGGRRVSSA
ncbi:amidohydrolase family protein [Azospirillum baldaniorum]|uniref:amidohydrolase family protein n=1 Tax=Azospirillum baldaniorum TaxID=1064539 RepID=UPI0011A580AF|nr:amidohydrolase family protein [Azospirillum baldaniorum]